MSQKNEARAFSMKEKNRMIQKEDFKMLLRFTGINLLLLFIACSNPTLQNIDFGNFNAIVPTDWNKIQLNGIDSNVNGLITDKNDTLLIDYGKYSDPFDDVIEVRSLQRKAEYDSAKFQYPSDMIFSETPEIDLAQSIYLKEYYFYEVIDGKKAKLGFPKISKNGNCLLHISNADKNGNKLSIYVKNVDQDTQNKVLSLFRSIKIKS